LRAEGNDLFDQRLKLREVFPSFPIVREVEFPLLDQAQQVDQTALLAGADAVVGRQEVADEDAGKALAEQLGDDFSSPMAVDVIDHHLGDSDAPQPVVDALLSPACLVHMRQRLGR
jgi:hypothetical protein